MAATNSRTGIKFKLNKVYSTSCKGFFCGDVFKIKNVGLEFMIKAFFCNRNVVKIV